MRKMLKAMICVACLSALSVQADNVGDDHVPRLHGLPTYPASSYSFSFAGNDVGFGYIGSSAAAASYLHRLGDVGSEVFTVGYAWRNLKFEGSTVSMKEREPGKPVFAWVESIFRIRKLSFNPAPDWTLQISRGYLSNLDQLEFNGDVRRTALSATYRRPVGEADWRTTLAWGRNERKYRESATGYLFESVFNLKSGHAFFGRLEQTGSDGLLRENESMDRQIFRMNKLTLGYLRSVKFDRSIKFDVGGLVTKHFVPLEMEPLYGAPKSCLMFVRFSL